MQYVWCVHQFTMCFVRVLPDLVVGSFESQKVVVLRSVYRTVGCVSASILIVMIAVSVVTD